jgi:hypothetical protein
MAYRVSAAENSHYRHGEERTVGIYGGTEEALAACRYVVDRSLRELYEEGMQAAELFRSWGMMGEDAWAVPLLDGDPKVEFSGQDYARGRSEDIARGG